MILLIKIINIFNYCFYKFKFFTIYRRFKYKQTEFTKPTHADKYDNLAQLA